MGTSSSSLATGLIRDGTSWLTARVSTFGRVWGTAMIAPWHCFDRYTVEGDQTRAIGFSVVVVAIWLSLGTFSGTVSYPVIGEMPSVSFVLWFAVLALLVIPIGLHVLAFISTLVILATVRERATVSETVQTIAFAMSPAVFLSVPVVEVQAVAAVHGSVLVVYGLRIVHATSFWRALLAGVLPAYLLFGLGFGAQEAVIELLRTHYII